MKSLVSDFPRVQLGHTPTPLELLDNVSAEFGTRVWIKRDDCTGLAFGGNKSRQLEFYLGDALAKGADTLLTTGATQSNHVRMTVAAARKLGLDVEAHHFQGLASQNGVDSSSHLSHSKKEEIDE